MNSDNQHNEELNIPGFSNQELKKDPFETPKGYFENLTPRIMSAVNDENTPINKSEGFQWKFLQIKILVPAFSILVLAIAALFTLNGNTLSLDQQFAEITTEMSWQDLAMAEDLLVDDLIAYDLLILENEEFEEESSISEYLLDNEVELSTIVDEITL